MLSQQGRIRPPLRLGTMDKSAMTQQSQYRDQVSDQIRRVTGITCESIDRIAPGYDPDGVVLDLASRSGIHPQQQASTILSDLMLLRVSKDYPEATACAFNERQLALWQYVRSAENWTIEDGVARSPDGVTVEVSEGRGEDGEIQFGFLASSGGQETIRLDIGDAISAGVASFDSARVMGHEAQAPAL